MDLIHGWVLPSRRLKKWVWSTEWISRACLVKCMERILDVRQGWTYAEHLTP